jgi:feruloyl esterase
LACELEFITSEAVSACDPNDGVVDGLISDVSKCHFDARSAVNSTFYCSATKKRMPFSKTAALVASAAWSGPRTANGEFLWHGYNRGSDISVIGSIPGQNSTGADLWFRLFVAKDKSFNVQNVTHEEYDQLFRRAVQDYTSLTKALLRTDREVHRAL